MSLQGFKDLGNGILIYNPTFPEDLEPVDQPAKAHSVHSPAKDDQPALVILCPWLGGATPKRIQRYTTGYHRLWPQSSILLIRTTAAEYGFSSVKSLQAKLRPAHREIRRMMVEGHAGLQAASSFGNLSPARPNSGSGRGILLHMFSNGGANMATQLVDSMNGILATLGKDEPLPLRQIVLDSCPGDLNINSTYTAASQSIPATHPLRRLFCASLYLVVAGIAGLEAVGLRRHVGKAICEQLNDPNVFSPSACRLYLVSQADHIVDFRNVEAHRDQALARGLRAETVVFQRAGHCCLVLEDEGAYWNAIGSCWASGERGTSTSCNKPRPVTSEDEGEPPGLGAENARGLLPQARSRL